MSDTVAEEKGEYALIYAVASNMDRLRQSINALRQIHDRWKDGNGVFINLIAQLTALKSHLGEMQDWMNYSIKDMHPHLLKDMELLMVSCGVLVRNLDDLVYSLRQDHNNTDWAIKLKYSVGSRTINRLRNVAKRQTEAVTLLLAACKCHATAQKKILLHKSRQIRQEDASSMSTLVRASKWNGRCMRTLTQVSRMIQWFRYVFYIKLFGKQHREPPTEQDYLDAAAAMRSEAIDRTLEEDAASLRHETKLVLFGSLHSGKDLIMRQMKTLYADGYPQEERREYIHSVRSTIRVLEHAIIDLLKDTGINLGQSLNQDFAILLHEVETLSPNKITPAAANAISNIWQSSQFSELFLKNFEIDFPQYSPYFAQEIHRIASPDYLPSEADIIRLNKSLRAIEELRFTWDDIPLHIFNISGFVPMQFRKRWIHQLEKPTALIYTVDVSTYDRAFYGQSTESQLLEDFATFESWANSPKFSTSSIILLLNNFTRFRGKLQHSPLKTFFPDFEGSGEDPETDARQYILRRFKDVNRNRLSIYSFWVDLDMSDNQHLYAALKKTLQHIHQRKARSEVWEANSQARSSRSGLLNNNNKSTTGPLSPKRSGTLTTMTSSSRG